MSDDGDDGSSYQPALAAGKKYIEQAVTSAGEEDVDIVNLLNEVDAAVLPVLSSIWECPMINKFAGFDDNWKSYAGWTCGGCPLENDGSQPKLFWSINATKALVHVAKVPGYDIRPCQGRIPAAKSKQYQDHHASKSLAKEQRKRKKDMMINQISDIQDRTVLSMVHGAKKLSRQAL